MIEIFHPPEYVLYVDILLKWFEDLKVYYRQRILLAS